MANSKTLTPEKMSRAAESYWKEVGPKIVAASKVKQLFKQLGLRTDGTLTEEIAKKLVKDLLGSAMRCVGNKRTTVRPIDL
jgi:polyhydroxyalkanoate synthesis regulator phasin